jgi:hypothetical protein
MANFNACLTSQDGTRLGERRIAIPEAWADLEPLLQHHAVTTIVTTPRSAHERW